MMTATRRRTRERFFRVIDADGDTRIRGDTTISVVGGVPVVGQAPFANETCFLSDVNGVGFPYDKDCNDASANLTVFGPNSEPSDGAGSDVGVEQLCDRLDDNCDGTVDEGLFVDADGDGFADNADANRTGLGSCAVAYPTTALPNFLDCNPNDPAVHPAPNASVDEDHISAQFCTDDIDNDCDLNTGAGIGGLGALSNNDNVRDGTFLLQDFDLDGFRNYTGLTPFNGRSCKVLFPAFFANDIFRFGQPFDCDDSLPGGAERFPCNDSSQFVCFDTNGVQKETCRPQDPLFCNRELLFPVNGIDNDCNLIVDDLIRTSVRLILRREDSDESDTDFSSSRKRHADDDDDSSSYSTSSSSSSSSSLNCVEVPLVISIENAGFTSVRDVIIRGQLDLPNRGTLTDFIFGDLTSFGMKVDENTLRVAWVQFSLVAGEKREITFPLCLRSRSDILNVHLRLAVEDFTPVLNGVFTRENSPNVQPDAAGSTLNF